MCAPGQYIKLFAADLKGMARFLSPTGQRFVVGFKGLETELTWEGEIKIAGFGSGSGLHFAHTRPGFIVICVIQFVYTFAVTRSESSVKFFVFKPKRILTTPNFQVA